MRTVTIWPGAAVTRPVMSRVPPLEPKRPPAKVVFWTLIAPDKVPTPEEAAKKMADSPLRPLANWTLIGLARVTPCSIWNWPALTRLTTLVLAPNEPEASTRKVPAAPPLMLTSPVKSLAAFLRTTRPGPVLVRPPLPVMRDSITRPPDGLVFHWCRMRSWPGAAATVPPVRVTKLAPTVGVIRIPPLVTVRPAPVLSDSGVAELKRSELIVTGEAPMVVRAALSTLAAAA